MDETARFRVLNKVRPVRCCIAETPQRELQDKQFLLTWAADFLQGQKDSAAANQSSGFAALA
ncbi:hypothetical protein [Tabrizicola sp.]|uniref:hypothetical protein n=1 Tax=Tabrizicola sp. TaxID=2005166 RepID=UPI0026190E6F|nr:hypothetical protein [Tabrizicola sp.]MDM7931901.1 hypothetical protein [Tabrizicola sp.]